FHLVGHSLGGQVAGAAGSALPGLPRITGLDPAAPWFEDEDPAVRLDPTDAGLVDILHTNGGPWWLGYVGISARHGHVDIYPNGGVIQPGCKKPAAGALEAILSGELLEVFQDLAGCSHKRSTVLYIDMLKKGSCPYIAVECNSYEDFEAGACSEGRVIDLTNVENEGFSGAGYMDTFAQTPYCGYHYVVAASVSADSSSPKGEIKLTLTSSKGQQTTALLVDGTIKAGTTQSVTHLSDTQLGDVTAADVSYERTSIMQTNTFVIDRLTVMSYRDSDWWSVL
ncbi:PREDICTED: inactive pancreatic lipase-related protein 1-like, partial [Priapulus caudatus]|uniref:Inactive pancreatic lipase-related protein 1-like n=1 Tax=Priapulus caudatus TaxID=37621 RepID=A0ABM1F518_PRICU